MRNAKFKVQNEEMVEFADKRVNVLGLGHFGGGIAVCRWLAGKGASVRVYDQSPPEKFADALQALRDLPIEFHLGPGNSPADFIHTDLIVASPAIPPHHQYLLAAAAADVPVTTEICLFIQRCPARVIGVTGTKGKSTTSTLLHRMLSARHATWFGGNIGKSLLPDLPDIKPDDLVVLELSSFMLEHLGKIKWSPHVAVVTMISTDHLDWHGSEENYINAKRNIVRFQKPGDFAVMNQSDVLGPTAAAMVPIRSLPRFELKLAGEHNQFNAQAAFAAASIFGVDWDTAQRAIADFTGLPHRLQLVHEENGVRFINDSIATIPEAAIAALNSFPPGKVIQIVGGSGKKHLPMEAMVTALGDRAKAILCIGETGSELAARLLPARCHLCGTLANAVQRAKLLATDGDIVLLSPGHPSYDQFTNFESRGVAFARLCRTTHLAPGDNTGGCVEDR